MSTAEVDDEQSVLERAVHLSRAEPQKAIGKEKGKAAPKFKQYVHKIKDARDIQLLDQTFADIENATGQVGAAALVGLATAYNSGKSSLMALMKMNGPLTVLQAFEQLWPDYEVTVELP